jgi:hypothetical protein
MSAWKINFEYKLHMTFVHVVHLIRKEIQVVIISKSVFWNHNKNKDDKNYN